MIRWCDHLFSMLLMTTLINPLTKIPWRAPAKQIRTIWIKRNHPHRHYIDYNCQSSKEKDLFSTNPRLTAQRRRRRLLPACISTWSSWSWSRLSSWSWSLIIVKIVIMIRVIGHRQDCHHDHTSGCDHQQRWWWWHWGWWWFDHHDFMIVKMMTSPMPLALILSKSMCSESSPTEMQSSWSSGQAMIYFIYRW